MEEGQINVVGNQPNSLAKKKFSLKGFSFVVTVIFSFLLPVFFIPIQTFSFLAGKEMILILTVLLLLGAWLVEKLVKKDFSFSFNIGILALIAVPVVYLFSALFSGSIKMAMVGAGFNLTAVSLITTLFLLMILVACSFDNKKQIITLYLGLLGSFIVVAFYHLLRLILGPEFLSFGLLTNSVSNLIGTWTELGIFAGLITVLSFVATFFLKESKGAKIISYVVLAISLFLVALVNSVALWFALALFFLSFFFYTLFSNRGAEKKISWKGVSWLAVILFVISLIFIFAKGPVGKLLPSLFGIANYEITPSLGATFDLAQVTLNKNPLLGAGPAQFSQQWAVNKPLAINNTQFWNTNFGSGIDFVLSSLVEVGLLGFLAWLFFFVALVYLTIKLLKVKTQNKLDRFIHLSVSCAVLYLWSFSFLYNPGIVILSLSAVFTGLLLFLAFQEKLIKLRAFSSQPQKIGGIVISIIFVSGFVYANYFFLQKTLASVKAQKSVVVLNTEGDLDQALGLMKEAVGHFESDEYYRLLTELDLYQLNVVLNQKDIDKETLQKQFQVVFQNAVADANLALQVDVNNYQNWLNLGRVYSTGASLGLEGAYDQAIQAYNNAVSLNPGNPLTVLSLANLEAVNGDTDKAKEYALAALQRKINYSDAYSFLTQIELGNDNQEEALNIINTWTQNAPNDPQPFLQLGIFAYNAGNYKEAISSLEQATVLNPNSLDTLYLLGLSYDKAGETEKALNLFGALTQALPKDETLKVIFDNLQNGKDALAGITQQSQVAELPVKEKENDISDEEISEEEVTE